MPVSQSVCDRFEVLGGLAMAPPDARCLSSGRRIPIEVPSLGDEGTGAQLRNGSFHRSMAETHSALVVGGINDCNNGEQARAADRLALRRRGDSASGWR